MLARFWDYQTVVVELDFVSDDARGYVDLLCVIYCLFNLIPKNIILRSHVLLISYFLIYLQFSLTNLFRFSRKNAHPRLIRVIRLRPVFLWTCNFVPCVCVLHFGSHFRSWFASDFPGFLLWRVVVRFMWLLNIELIFQLHLGWRLVDDNWGLENNFPVQIKLLLLSWLSNAAWRCCLLLLGARLLLLFGCY